MKSINAKRLFGETLRGVRSVWQGSSNYKVGGSSKEQSRHRRRILAGTVPNSQIHGDILTAIGDARDAEFPLTSIKKKAA